MAQVVTIEGTLTPSTYLARGQRADVELTPEVLRKVALGYVKVVKYHELTDTEVEADANAEAARAELVPDPVNPPKRNASREDWAEFLAQHASGAFVTEGKDREQLIAEWDAYLETS